MSSSHPPESHERAYLAELMRDFPSEGNLTVDDALRLLSLRFKNLDTESIAEGISQYDDWLSPASFNLLPRHLHAYLYKDILGNSGSYRQSTEKNNGIIFFGSNQKFRGVSPANISSSIQESVANFSPDDPQPIFTIVKFYQQFVFIHPFYDANGRIGRLITNIYLDLHGYFISWEKLHRNTKWLDKLNACHVRTNSDIYDEYLQYLVNYWDSFIIEKSSILPPDGFIEN